MRTSFDCKSSRVLCRQKNIESCFKKNQKNPDLDLCLLLWSERVKLSVFKEIIDVVVVNLNVGHKNTVTAVLIHIIAFTRLL